jgi:mitochondrial-processing peptidase subunit alpha
MFTFKILRLKAELAKSSSDLETFLLEALRSTAYSGALANPLITIECSASRLNADVMEKFILVIYLFYVFCHVWLFYIGL